MTANACFHCGSELRCCARDVSVGNDNVRVCSDACETAVRRIHEAGLDDFYEHREQPGGEHRDEAALVSDWQTYERPALLREFVRQEPDGTQIADLLVQGVHCAACTWLIENALSRIPGVISINVNPVTTRGELHFDPRQARLADLLADIAALGYNPTPFTELASYRATENERRLALRRLLVAGLGMMQVMSYAVALYAGAFQGMDPNIETFLRFISLLVATPVVLYAGAPFFSGAWRNLRARALGMDVPVAIAIGTAWAASVWNTFTGSGEVYFDSATMFVFFLSGTRYLEAAGRYRALDVTHALAQHVPCTARRLTDSGVEEVGVMELSAGDRVLVAPGQAFPADGVLTEGTTRVDESMLTGESAPVSRMSGDAVVAGTTNLASPVTLTVQQTGADTVLAHIGRLVTLAGNEKPRLVELTDRIASVFVAAVLILAATAGAIWYQLDASRAFEIVLTVLVVTCPCALALATPAAFTVATSALARSGFLVRRPGAISALAKVDTVVFDKTGTLTKNALEIAGARQLGDMPMERARAVAGALERHSAHPIARAFRTIDVNLSARSVISVPGGGLEGLVDGTQYRIGTRGFAGELSGTAMAADEGAERVVYLGGPNGLLAAFTLSEEVRPGAAQLIRRLQDRGIASLIASGDRAEPVDALARSVGISDWRAGLLPEDKLDLVRTRQQSGHRVAAVGDGINDSPVLAGADVSIAMGSGTSIAQHSADGVWLGHHLSGLEQAFDIARATARIVRQNLTWALCYNALAIPLALTGWIEPWMAALGMSLSSLLVMLNALRLGRAARTENDTVTAAHDRCASQPELAA